MNNSILFVIAMMIWVGCTRIQSNNDQIPHHWHCESEGKCDFQTIDIVDSTFIADKHIIGNYPYEFSNGPDIKVYADQDDLILQYTDTSLHFIKSNLEKCLFSDRYFNSLIDLSLPEVESALSFEDSRTHFTSGNLFVGKLKKAGDGSEALKKLYPDSIFIQAEDVLINYRDIPLYVARCNDCLDCPRLNINIHADKNVPEGVVRSLINLIDPMNHSAAVHIVVQIKNRDIGLLRIR